MKAIASAPACCMPGCNRPGVHGSGVDLLAVPPRWGRWLCIEHGRRSGEPAAVKDPVTAREAKAPAMPQGRLL